MSHLFHAEIGEGIYLISSNRSGTSLSFGPATGNVYLVTGADKALLFDLGVDEAGVKEYAQNLAGKEVLTVVSHGHPDHMYRIGEHREIYLHEADWNFPLWDVLKVPVPERKPVMRPVPDGTRFNLGGRVLQAIHFPGHTPGSILLYDERTGILLSGDAVARRLLYGLTGGPTLDVYCRMLGGLRQKNITAIYSAHDRAPISPDYMDTMIRHIRDDLPRSQRFFHMDGVPDMVNYVCGQEAEADFFDVTAAKDFL